jgi:hypothetical protein
MSSQLAVHGDAMRIGGRTVSDFLMALAFEWSRNGSAS